MKVLWFTALVMPEFSRRLGIPPSVKGGWMHSLADALNRTGKVNLGIAACIEGKFVRREEINGTIHYGIPLQCPGEHESEPATGTIEACKRIVAEFKPDVIHIHGTEKFFGLLTARGHVREPALVSIQGLIHVYERYYYGGLSFRDLIGAHSLADCVYRNGLFHQKRRWRRRAQLECEIIAGNRQIVGRTMWDLAHVREINPSATYHHCDELMRPPFYHTEWQRKTCRTHTIFSPTGEYPLKGIHWLLRAAAILKREFPDLKVRIADGAFARGLREKTAWDCMKMPGYSLYLGRLVDDLGLQDVVQLTGQLNAEQMAGELARAHVFVTPSMVENGCNALHEAALVGTPCVVSLAGGMTSMIEDRRTAIGFPMGDEAMLAEGVRTIFTDDRLAERLSGAARQQAQARHAESLSLGECWKSTWK